MNMSLHFGRLGGGGPAQAGTPSCVRRRRKPDTKGGLDRPADTIGHHNCQMLRSGHRRKLRSRHVALGTSQLTGNLIPPDGIHTYPAAPPFDIQHAPAVGAVTQTADDPRFRPPCHWRICRRGTSERLGSGADDNGGPAARKQSLVHPANNTVRILDPPPVITHRQNAKRQAHATIFPQSPHFGSRAGAHYGPRAIDRHPIRWPLVRSMRSRSRRQRQQKAG